MNDTVYYYQDPSGFIHFSTGVTRDKVRAEQYIRMLHFARRETKKLSLDNPKDREAISELFMAKSEQ